ncbi:FHA domain-containing protein [Rhodoglobus sp.]
MKRAEKKAKAAALLSARRRHSVESGESAEVAPAAASRAVSRPTIPTSTAATADIHEVNTETSPLADETHQFDETAPTASDTIVLQLGEPLVLPSADELSAHDVGDFPNTPTDDSELVQHDGAPEDEPEDGPEHEVLPFDEDGPYDEVVDPSVLTFAATISPSPVVSDVPPAADEGWRDLPAPNPQEVAWPQSPDATADEAAVDAAAADEAVVVNDAATENSLQSETEGDSDHAPKSDDEIPIAEIGDADAAVVNDAGVDAGAAKAGEAADGGDVADDDGALVDDDARGGDDPTRDVNGSLEEDHSGVRDSDRDGVVLLAGDAPVPAPQSESQPETETESDAKSEPEPAQEPAPEPQPQTGHEEQAEPELPAEPEALVEPEPLVEPSPLPRSAFEPDLKNVGRPEVAVPAAERSPAKQVRPLGEETLFTTADRLRASAFAPVASERVADQPAPSTTAVEPEAEVTSFSATAPRASDSVNGPQNESVASVDSEKAPTAPLAVAASSDAVCAQCGEALSESDIFCGSCGFVKHGIGPTARTAVAPPLDPFPWGKPTARTGAVASARNTLAASHIDEVAAQDETEQNQNVEQAELAEQAQQSGHAEVAEQAEIADQVMNAGNPESGDAPELPTISQSDDDNADSQNDHSASSDEARDDSGDPQFSDADSSSRAAEIGQLNSEAASASAPRESIDSLDEAASVGAVDGSHNDSAAEFERLSAVPDFASSDDQRVAEEVSASTDGSGASETAGLSVLAPPPMSHHRVELPIAPPTPIASLASDDEDIEDTRIVERSLSGTRFVLQFSTGDSVIVTGTGLVGRNPIAEPSEKFDILVPITDPSKSVSKTHLEFGQITGAFWISDRYSGNGTVVREPGGEPKRCEPGKRYRVMRGTRVEIGEQFFIVS